MAFLSHTQHTARKSSEINAIYLNFAAHCNCFNLKSRKKFNKTFFIVFKVHWMWHVSAKTWIFLLLFLTQYLFLHTDRPTDRQHLSLSLSFTIYVSEHIFSHRFAEWFPLFKCLTKSMMITLHITSSLLLNIFVLLLRFFLLLILPFSFDLNCSRELQSASY